MSDTPSTASEIFFPSRNFFRPVAVITSLWWLALIGIAVGTTYPVTLNAKQIELSDCVILARVVDRAAGTVEVEASWKAELPRGRITIHNFAASKPELTGTPLLIPLTFWAVGYEVAPIPPPGRGAVVYPATPSTREQLARLLKSPP
jgi:hypothetical protein